MLQLSKMESIPYLESEMEIKYELHEYIDIKEIKEEPADYQQSQIKIEDFLVDASPNDQTFQKNITEDIYSSEDYSDDKNLDHSETKFCEYECDKVTDLKSHVMVIHNGDSEHLLYKKDQSSNSKYHMKKRILETQTNEKHKWKTLEKNCDDKGTSHSHSKNWINSEHMYKGDESTQPSILELHNNSVGTRKKIHEGQYGIYRSPKMLDLKRHTNSVYTREKVYNCQYCDYGSTRMANLKLHINSIHTRAKIHKCQYCDYGSPNMTHLKRHINSIHTREKLHKCKYCNYESPCMSTLKNHIYSIHTREKIHKCEYCDYGSPQKASLKRHINSLHTRENIYKCKYCDYGSPWMSALRNHIKSIHTREKIH